jgi:prenyltransferase beta subunit
MNDVPRIESARKTQRLKYWRGIVYTFPNVKEQRGVRLHRYRNGAFGGSPRHDPHILYTTSAVQLLALFERLDLVDADATAACVHKAP